MVRWLLLRGFEDSQQPDAPPAIPQSPAFVTPTRGGVGGCARARRIVPVGVAAGRGSRRSGRRRSGQDPQREPRSRGGRRAGPRGRGGRFRVRGRAGPPAWGARPAQPRDRCPQAAAPEPRRGLRAAVEDGGRRGEGPTPDGARGQREQVREPVRRWQRGDHGWRGGKRAPSPTSPVGNPTAERRRRQRCPRRQGGHPRRPGPAGRSAGRPARAPRALAARPPGAAAACRRARARSVLSLRAVEAPDSDRRRGQQRWRVQPRRRDATRW